MRFRWTDRIAVALLAAVTLAPCMVVADAQDGELVFVVAADMRNFAKNGGRTKHFSGACEAIREAGRGSFMISPGDLDVEPPSAVRGMISEVLGEDYPWYPVIGNHELESPSTMRYLREYSSSVPNVVNRGPAGCEETTYSFDWASSHFVVLNLYCDGVRDWGREGDVVPELLAWLDADLAANRRRHVFVFGHEPLVAVPDMDNGRVRHQGDSLDEDPESAFAFHRVLLKHQVDAYICGHTHNASHTRINGLWQLDAGHARGPEEASYAEAMFEAIERAFEEGKKRGVGESGSLRQLYRDDAYHVHRWFKYMGLEEQPVIQTLAQFYDEYSHDPTARDRYYEAQIEHRMQARSTFLRVLVGSEAVRVEFYRDDARGGPYTLRETVILH